MWRHVFIRYTVALLAVIACLVIDYAFRRILLVPLPLGPLAGVIW